jgi:hypothetical protein
MIEKRRLPRHQLRLPISVGSASTFTTDVSAGGVRFEAQPLLTAGSEIEFALTLRESGEKPICVECRGRVVRVETRGGRTFIAATIEEMKFAGDKRTTWEH